MEFCRRLQTVSRLNSSQKILLNKKSPEKEFCSFSGDFLFFFRQKSDDCKQQERYQQDAATDDEQDHDQGFVPIEWIEVIQPHAAGQCKSTDHCKDTMNSNKLFVFDRVDPVEDSPSKHR